MVKFFDYTFRLLFNKCRLVLPALTMLAIACRHTKHQPAIVKTFFFMFILFLKVNKKIFAAKLR